MGDLLARTAELVNVASVSRNESVLADLVEAELRATTSLEVVRIENNVIARREQGDGPRLLLGGHLDTVPPAGNDRARLDGSRCYGVGAADMKGGLAVLLELARSIETASVPVSFVLYACEEVARAESGLLAIERADPRLLDCDAAILCEPTSGFVEAGCQGVLRAAVHVGGKAAHAARPWMGSNAIHRLGPILDRLASFEERCPVIDGCTYRESMQAVRVSGGVASNVVAPQAVLELSIRFAPDRDVSAATAAFEAYLDPVIDKSAGDRLEVLDVAPAAPPALSSTIISSLVTASARRPRAKLGWTDVAIFAERHIPATNYGPGDPELSHTSDEFVAREDLDSAYEVLLAIIETAH